VGNLLANLADEDRVGLVTIPLGGVNIGLTDRHETIETELAAMLGRAGREDTASDAACRALLTLGALQSVFDGLAGASHTTVVFFSGGLVAANTELSVKTGPTGETCELRTDNFRDTAAAAHKVPIDFYVAFIPEDVVSGAASAVNTRAGLENLAGVTGNAMIRLAGESESQMTQLADETAAYYVATFEPDASERTGAAYRVDLRVNREGVKARARQAVTIDKGAAGGNARKGPSVKDMMRVGTMSRELPLRASAFAAREAGSDQLKLVALFEPRDSSFTLTSAAVALFDSRGKLTAQWTGQAAELKRSPVVGALLVKPGLYRMRVAAIDAAGRRGTVDLDATVELVGAGSSSLSALVLGTRTGSGFAPKLLFDADEPAVFGYVEVYNVPKEAAIGASFELASSADGPATVTVPAALSPASQGDMRALMGIVPITSLPPGDFVLRANVSVDGQPAGRVVRTFRKAGQ
jgi:hypothetical protein